MTAYRKFLMSLTDLEIQLDQANNELQAKSLQDFLNPPPEPFIDWVYRYLDNYPPSKSFPTNTL